MFRIVDGAPGSGKTYYGVNYLKKYCQFDKLYQTIDLQHDVMLITNIDDIKIPHISFDDFLSSGFINYEKCKNFMIERGYKHGIFLIDEAQKYFSNLRDNDIFYFFEAHRHLGLDIFLFCPSASTLPRRLVSLAEYLMNAQTRTKQLVGFQYTKRDVSTGEKIGTVFLKTDKQVFQLYRSFERDESTKPKAEVRNKIVVGVSAFIGCIIILTYVLKAGLIFGGISSNEKPELQTVEMVSTVKKHQPGTVDNPKAPISDQIDDTPQKDEWKPTARYIEIPSNDIVQPSADIAGSVTAKGKTFILYR